MQSEQQVPITISGLNDDNNTTSTSCCTGTPLLSSCGTNKNSKRWNENETSVIASPEVDALMAKELNALSLNERTQVLEEIHGIPDVIDEEPDFIDMSLAQFEEELKKHHSNRDTFDLAMQLNARHVTDRKFRLMFLRAESFDARKAAIRFIKYFEYKLELFGKEKLVKKITFDDLDNDDQEALRSCTLRFPDSKDRSGRTIMLSYHKLLKYKTPDNQIRNEWYQIMKALDDESTQKLGIVAIVYGDTGNLMPPVFSKVHVLKDGLPFRFACMHFCYNDTRLRTFLSLVLRTVDSKSRLRFRPHYGTPIECRYALMTYGIPVDSIPIDPMDKVKRLEFLALVESRCSKERALLWSDNDDEMQGIETLEPQVVESKGKEDTSSTLSIVPKPADVLLGKGKMQNKHPGNLKLIDIVSRKKVEYQAASKFEKVCIGMDIVKTVKDSNGRFLKKDANTDGWVEVDEVVARDTVAHRFRNNRRVNDAKAKTTKSAVVERERKRARR